MAGEMQLPLDNEEPKLVPPLKTAGAEIYVGTSGFKFPDWKGPFYPPGLKEKDWLTYYGQRFNTLEINSSYYRHNHPNTYALDDGEGPAGVSVHGEGA